RFRRKGTKAPPTWSASPRSPVPLEFFGGFTIMRASRSAVWAWLLAALGLIGLYVLSRLLPLPFISQQYVFGPIGVISNGSEPVLAFALAQELWTTSPIRHPPPRSPHTHSTLC